MIDQNKWNYLVGGGEFIWVQVEGTNGRKMGKHLEDSHRQLFGDRIYQNVFKDWQRDQLRWNGQIQLDKLYWRNNGLEEYKLSVT